MTPKVLLSILTCLISSPAFALTGFDIAKKAEENIIGYKSQRVNANWQLFGADKKPTVVYKTLQLTREGEAGSGPKSLIRFLAPADTKGTALLTQENPESSDSRWLYLSETRQIKRISTANMSAAFKGTEFSYEDLLLKTLERYNWKLLGEKELSGKQTYVVERKAKFEGSGYSKAVVYFDKETYTPIQTRYFNPAGKPLKVARLSKYKKYNGKWRAHVIIMDNVLSKRRTAITFGAYKLGLKLPARIFTKAQLAK